MKHFLRTPTLLFGAAFFALAQAGVDEKAHEVKNYVEYQSIPEVEVEALDSGYGRENEGGGKDKGGNGYRYGMAEGITTTTKIETRKNGHHHNKSKTYYGMNNTSIAIAESTASVITTATSGYVNVEMQYSRTEKAQLSFDTKTVFASRMAETVTVTPLPDIITQMATVTEAGQMVTDTEEGGMTTVTGAGQMTTVTTTITEAGTCSTVGLATGETAAAQSSIMTTMEGVAYTSSSYAEMETMTAMDTSAQTTTTTMAAYSAASIVVALSGQVAKGTGTINAAGCCDCQCLCSSAAFPTMMVGMSAMAPPPATITMQTVAASMAAASIAMASSMADTGASYMAPPYGNATITTSIEVASAISNIESSTSTSVMAAAATTESSASIVSMSIESSSPTTTSGSLDMSTSTTTSTSSDTSSTSADPTLVSAMPLLASSNPAVTIAASASGPIFPINLSTASLSSELVLGNLAQQAYPTT